MNEKVQGVIGIVVFLVACFLLSEKRSAVKLRIVAFGLTLQFVFALIVLKTELGKNFFSGANDAIMKLLAFSNKGIEFVFGPLGIPPENTGSIGFVFAVRALCPIIFFAALMSVLYHLGIMQLIVRVIAWVVQRSLKTSGAETLSAAANIFVGQTEAPLLVKPFIEKMTRSEIMAVMTGGFATVAGGVMASYVAMLSNTYPGIAGHLLAGSTMAAPAGLMIAKLLVPETETAATANSLDVNVEKNSRNVIDAAATGASDGMMLVLNVAAMLVAFISLIALVDAGLGWVGDYFGRSDLSLIVIFKTLFSPLAWLMGISSQDTAAVGGLLGTKLVATEFVAFDTLAKVGSTISERSGTLTAYALCGFANFASIAIQIGGIGAMAPSRRGDLASIGVKAMFAGFLTTCLTATVAGLVL